MVTPLDWPAALIRLARFAALPGATVEATGDGGGRITTIAGIVHVGPQQWRAFTGEAIAKHHGISA